MNERQTWLRSLRREEKNQFFFDQHRFNSVRKGFYIVYISQIEIDLALSFQLVRKTIPVTTEAVQ